MSILLILCLLVHPASVSPLSAAKDHKYIRVAILKDVTKVAFSMRGQYKIIDPVSKKTLYEGRSLRKTFIEVMDQGVMIGVETYPLKRIRLLPSKDVDVAVNKHLRRYKGVIDILVTKENKMLVINILPLERYVRGVLYHEVSHRWPLEAIKAQAVAARTYALYQMSVSQKREYDVTSDIYSQVYGGRSSERYRTNLAVRRTRDEIMTFAGEVLPAYYHSNCGGHTENVSELWNHKNLSPLEGQVCLYCASAPNYQWKKNFQSNVIQEKLKEKDYKIGLIKNIEVIERTKSRRAKKLKITDRSGASIEITAKEFRNLIGPNQLKSNFYRIEMKGYFFDVYGRGWGHGVGMCQWGAYNMALKRFNYKEILDYYYPGVDFGKND